MAPVQKMAMLIHHSFAYQGGQSQSNARGGVAPPSADASSSGSSSPSTGGTAGILRARNIASDAYSVGCSDLESPCERRTTKIQRSGSDIPSYKALDDIRIDFDCPRCGSTIVEAYGRLKASPRVECECGASIRVEIEIGNNARRDWRVATPTPVVPQNDN